MAEQGKRVLLVDIDPQGNATSGLGRAHEDGSKVYDVLIGACEAREAVVATGCDSLDLMPSAIELAGAEIELVGMDNREMLLKEALRPLAQAYDYVFADCPPSLSLLTLNALSAADTVLIPIQCEYYALEGVGQLVNTIKLMRKKLNPRWDRGHSADDVRCAHEPLRAGGAGGARALPEEAFETMIPRNVRLSEAPSYGLPIHLYDGRCSGRRRIARWRKN